MRTIVQIDPRGTLTIPKKLREKFGLGAQGILDETHGGLVLRPAANPPAETCTNERIPEFRLNNALDAADYRAAPKDVRAMGIDPDTIPHTPIKSARRRIRRSSMPTFCSLPPTQNTARRGGCGNLPACASAPRSTPSTRHSGTDLTPETGQFMAGVCVVQPAEFLQLCKPTK
jgi:bifunctional DNA-binding transcriptional regulator/antitoxin component of YhaV-PrlF toxin-antitoxin module